MTVTSLGEITVGSALPCAVTAVGAVNASVGLALPEATAKLAGYAKLSVPSPSFDMTAQLALTANGLAAAIVELQALPGGAGVALATALTAGITAQATAQAAIKTAAPAIALKIDSALAGKAALDVQASAGISGPNVNFPLIAEMISMLGETIATLEAQASIAAGISANLGVGGVRAYRFDGDLSVAGNELHAQFGAEGITGDGHFVVFVANTSVSWTALQAVLKTV